jgi:hypothetical protein
MPSTPSSASSSASTATTVQPETGDDIIPRVADAANVEISMGDSKKTLSAQK